MIFFLNLWFLRSLSELYDTVLGDYLTEFGRLMSRAKESELTIPYFCQALDLALSEGEKKTNKQKWRKKTKKTNKNNNIQKRKKGKRKKTNK